MINETQSNVRNGIVVIQCMYLKEWGIQGQIQKGALEWEGVDDDNDDHDKLICFKVQ